MSYTHPERDVSTSTLVRISEPTDLNLNVASALNGSLAWSYYGSNVTQTLVQGFNVTFGNAQDGFYSRTNYTTWYVSCFPHSITILICIYRYSQTWTGVFRQQGFPLICIILVVCLAIYFESYNIYAIRIWSMSWAGHGWIVIGRLIQWGASFRVLNKQPALSYRAHDRFYSQHRAMYLWKLKLYADSVSINVIAQGWSTINEQYFRLDSFWAISIGYR